MLLGVLWGMKVNSNCVYFPVITRSGCHGGPLPHYLSNRTFSAFLTVERGATVTTHTPVVIYILYWAGHTGREVHGAEKALITAALDSS